MRTKVIILFFLASLYGCHTLSAQQQGLFYYYKGSPIPLNINSQHFLVYADAEKTTIEELEKEFRITELIETGQNGFFEMQINVPNGNYDSVVNVLKAKEYIIDVEPVIGDSVLYNTSRLFYVKLHEIQDYPLLSSIALRTGAEIRGSVSFCENWYELSVNKNSVSNSIETANQFWETQYFENVDPGFIFHFEPTSGSACVSDYRFDEQWGMQSVKACSAWKITKGDTSVRIAVIDRGIDEDHQEFDGTNIVFSYDAESNSSPAIVYSNDRSSLGPQDPDGYHGIHVGGIIFANHNRYSVVGIAPETSMINISTCFKYNDSMAIKLASSFYQAIAHNARVINNSWGDNMGGDLINIYLHSVILENAIETAIDNQTIVVFSVGNNDCQLVSYPACYKEEILAVGSITQYEFQGMSCFGSALDIMAPGNEILSTYNNNGYYYLSGTSMAAPHVSGVAGLLFSTNPELSGQDVRDIIEQTARKVHSDLYDYSNTIGRPNGSWCPNVGYGLLDAHRAVLKAAYHKVYGDTALTLCDTSRHIYTVRAPHNANIDSVTFFWTCSDNLQIVAGQTTDSVRVKRIHSGTGQLQCHIVHDGDTVTTTLEIPILSGRTTYDNMSLYNGFAYPDTFVLSREIVIDSLSSLTWQNRTVLCTPDCRIIVRPGGFLTLDHTTLTSACPGEMWQGIEVVGNSGLPQILHNNGILYIENGSVIENAYTAVRNCLASDNAYTTTGGNVQAYSSTFRNNCRSVKFDSYGYTSQPGLMPDYSSMFRQCTFVVNDQNLFAANDTVFTEHVKLWEVKGVKFKGCSFYDSTSTFSPGRRGVYTEDAGVTLDTYCDDYYVGGCECPENHSTNCSFSGFTTAVEVNTTGCQYPVLVNQVRFSNNGTGVKVNGNHFATVTRCTFNLDQWPDGQATGNTGLRLIGSSGYKVEGNTFERSSYPTAGMTDNSTGISVSNSGTAANSLYRNNFSYLTYGISASGTNSNLQMACDSFYYGKYDIYIPVGGLISSQGSLAKGADNCFKRTQTSSLYSVIQQKITYYYSAGSFHTPTNPVNISTDGNASACDCAPTLCDNGGGVIKTIADFQSDMDADTYYDTVRSLMSDSLLDLSALEQWHAAAQPIADPYSLTETRFMEGYAESFAAAADDAELANYAEFHAMKVALRAQNDNADSQNNNNGAGNDGSAETQNFASLQPGGHVNWYALTPAQIAQLQTIAERNTGRASVMAKGVLCFFFGICYEDAEDTDPSAETQAKRTATGEEGVFDTPLRVWPNPTDDLLFVELRGAEIASVALYDLQGRIVTGVCDTPLQTATATLNMKSVPAGVYVLRVTDAEGREHQGKIVKR